MSIRKEAITVVRQSEGTYTNGVFVAGGTREWTVHGNVQPITPREIERLPETARTDARFIMYCYSDQPEIGLTELDDQKRAAQVVWHGDTYDVVALGDWAHLGATAAHRAYALVEVGAEEDDE